MPHSDRFRTTARLDERFENSHHQLGSSILVSAPDEYDLPDDGPTTTLDLTTPTGEPVGTLLYNDGAVACTPTGQEGDPSLDAQEHAAEVLRLLRDFRAEGIDLPEAIQFIRDTRGS